MFVEVYVLDVKGEEINEKDRVIWYPALEGAVRSYLGLFNSPPFIGLLLTEGEDVDPVKVRSVTVNPILGKVTVGFELFR